MRPLDSIIWLTYLPTIELNTDQGVQFLLADTHISLISICSFQSVLPYGPPVFLVEIIVSQGEMDPAQGCVVEFRDTIVRQEQDTRAIFESYAHTILMWL